MSNVTLPMAGGFTDQGPNRPANQDAYFAEPDRSPAMQVGALYMVADGVGGQQKGEEASQIAVQVIPEIFYKVMQQPDTTIPQALLTSFEQANSAINQRTRELNLKKMSTTAVTAVIFEGKLYLAHAGDARAYLLRGHGGVGNLQQLTKDHSWVQEQVDAGVIPEKEADHIEGPLGHIVTRVLGNNGNVKPDVTPEPRPLRTDDQILLCSDGLYKTLPEAEIVRLMRQGSSPEQTAKALVEAAIEANADDNITAVLIEIGPVTGIYRQPNPLKEGVGQSRVPLWIPLLVVALIVLAVIIYFASRGIVAGADATGGILPTVAAVAASLPTETAVPVQVQITTETVEADRTESEATASDAPVESSSESGGDSSPQATSTLAPTPTALRFASVNELVEQLPIWPTEALSANSCAVGGTAIFALRPNERISLMQMEPETFLGPEPDCEQLQFVQVRSEERSGISGWVLRSQIVLEPEPAE